METPIRVFSPANSIDIQQHPLDLEQEASNSFQPNTKVILRNTLLSYPNFDQPFDIHMDISNLQLGAVISQNGKPIVFYSR